MAIRRRATRRGRDDDLRDGYITGRGAHAIYGLEQA